MNKDDYEGHTEGEWKLLGDDEQGYGVKTPKHDDPMAFIERRNDDGEVVSLSKADAQLIAAAPDLLAEVKRLQRKIDYVKELTLSMPVGFKRIDSISASIIEAICTKEEYIALGFPVSSNLEYRGDD